MSGVLPTNNGLLIPPIKTPDNTLDDGSGNTTIAGALSAGSATVSGALNAGSAAVTGDFTSGNATIAGALNAGITTITGPSVQSATATAVFDGGNQSIMVLPNLYAENYNPLSHDNDVGLISTPLASTMMIAPWSDTASGLRLLGTGEVQSANNVLDDGSGNATIKGALSVRGELTGFKPGAVELSSSYTFSPSDNDGIFYVNAAGLTLTIPASLPTGWNVTITCGGTYPTTLVSNTGGIVGLSGTPTTITLGAVSPSMISIVYNGSGLQLLSASPDIWQAYNAVSGDGGQIVTPLTIVGDANGVVADGNNIIFDGAISGQTPNISTSGVDANISLSVNPKGTGIFIVEGSQNVTGNSSVSGALNAGSATVSGALNAGSAAVTGDFTSGNATIAGALTPYAIGARGFVYDIRVAGVPVDGTTDATAALNALFTDGIAAEFFFPAGTTVLVAGTVTLPDAPITCRGVYGLSQIQFTGSGQFLSDNANSPSGVHPQHKFEGINFVVGGSVPALEYNWSVYSQPITTGAQEASIVFRDCGFFATTAATTAYLVSLSNIAQMLFDNCAGYATYGSGSSAADAPAQCVIGAFGSSTGGLTFSNCRFNGWSRAPIIYVNGNGQTPNFQGVTLTNTTLMSNGASMGLVAIDVTGLILANSYIDYCCQNIIFQGDDFYASNCWISYSPSPNNQAVTPSSGATVTYPATNVSNLTIQGSATLAALTVELPVPAWQGVACSITFDVAVSALTITAPTGYSVNTYPASVAAGQTITFYFNVAVPNNDTWYELASGGPAAIMFQGPRNNFSNLHVQAYAPSVSTDPTTIAYGILALGASTLNWSGGDASVGLVSAVYESQFNDASFIPSNGYGIVGVGGVPFQVVQAQFTMNSGGTCNGPFAIAAGNGIYVTDFDLPSGATETTQTFHAPVSFNSPVTMANALYLENALVGNPSIQSQPVVSEGTWVQNTSGGPLWLCLPVILGANAAADLYISSASSGAASVDISNFENGNSADIVVTLSGLVPAGWWWNVSASGSYTLNSSSYPNGAVRVI